VAQRQGASHAISQAALRPLLILGQRHVREGACQTAIAILEGMERTEPEMGNPGPQQAIEAFMGDRVRAPWGPP
jgi:hypothetical protein